MSREHQDFGGASNIADVFARFAAAYNAGDAAKFAAAFEHDATFVNIAAGRADGRPAIEATHPEAFRTLLKSTLIEFVVTDHRLLEPAVALAHAH